MSAVGTLTANVNDLFMPFTQQGISIISPWKGTVPYMEPSAQEVSAIQQYLYPQLEILQENARPVYNIVASQEKLVYIAAGIFKAKLEGKSTYAYPPTPSSLGVGFLIPEFVLYASGVPTGYIPGTWRIPTTAGTPVYVLGSPTQWYTASATPGSRSFLLIFQDGLVEVGSTPTFRQMQVLTQTSPNYGPITVEPMVDVQIEPSKSYYIYPTLGALLIPYDIGVKLALMPYRTVPDGADVRLIGLAFYEYNFYSSMVY